MNDSSSFKEIELCCSDEDEFPVKPTQVPVEDEYEVKYAWDSGKHSKHSMEDSIHNLYPEVEILKRKGNDELKRGHLDSSLQYYTEALSKLEKTEGAYPALLRSNMSHVYFLQRKFELSLKEAEIAHNMRPTWPKPLYRMAAAALGMQDAATAITACKRGEELVSKSVEGESDFSAFLDEACILATRQGLMHTAFPGTELEVRSPGEDAWLGGSAPHVPDLDGPNPEDEDFPLVALPPAETLGQWQLTQRKRTSFRNIKEAVAAAKDGDRIVLKKGVHNGMGESVTVKKRILITGEGRLGEAVIDQRANCPMFRVVRGGVVLKNMVIDQTGFRESLLFEGKGQSYMVGCEIKCSGDNAIDVGGCAKPCFARCAISSKKSGIRVFDNAVVLLENCMLEKCGSQGLRAQDNASVTVIQCMIQECDEEGVVVMDSAQVHLEKCSIKKTKGPGIDVSGQAAMTAMFTLVDNCVGGVWAWDSAKIQMSYCTLQHGPSHSILADGSAVVNAENCTCIGSVHATEHAWGGLSVTHGNIFSDPEMPTDFPPEEGPFVYYPEKYTRL